MVRFLLLLLMSASPWVILAQMQGAPQSLGIIYNRETAFNLTLHTARSFAASLDRGKLITYDRTNFVSIGFGELRHSKEMRQSADPSVSRSFRPYIFGKQNNLYAIRGAWGAKKYFSEKSRQRGVAVGMSYRLGPTLGILKPYYLALRRVGDSPTTSRIMHERYSEENAGVFLDNTRILGASPFTRGFDEISLLPGGSGALALHLDWGAFDEFIKAFEIGIMADVFLRPAPILVGEQGSRQAFINFFVNLQFGKRS